ncbi:hypothetical protein CERSUDRAFT_113026, partial [Gelatoporia subvermispora B]
MRASPAYRAIHRTRSYFVAPAIEVIPVITTYSKLLHAICISRERVNVCTADTRSDTSNSRAAERPICRHRNRSRRESAAPPRGSHASSKYVSVNASNFQS